MGENKEFQTFEIDQEIADVVFDKEDELKNLECQVCSLNPIQHNCII